jgi:hypothetical protein
MASISDILLAQGQRSAESRRRLGEISAGMWSNLGQQAAGAIQQYAQHQQQEPIRRQEQEIRDLQLGELKDSAEARKAATEREGKFAETLKNPNRAKVLESLSGDPDAYKRATEHFARMDEGYNRLMGEAAAGVRSFGDSPEAAMAALDDLIAQGFDERRLEQYRGAIQKDPKVVSDLIDALLKNSPDERHRSLVRPAPKAPEPFTLSPGQTRYGPDGKPLASAAPEAPKPPPVGSFEDYVQRVAAAKGVKPEALSTADIEDARKRYQQADDRPPVQLLMRDATRDEAEAIGDAIIAGEQPPDLKGLFRYGAQVRAYLAKQGYDLAKATIDWKATERFVSTLNGPGQIRLMQATEFVAHTVPLVEELSRDLTKKLPRSQFPVLNKAARAAAKSGVLGQEAQNIATQLEAQITDLQAELAVMYRGGNAPTDESMKKADQMLRGDWGESQLQAALDLISKNVQIRLNSLRAVGVGGSDTNRYAPKRGGDHNQPPPPPGRTGGAPSYQDYLNRKRGGG